MRIPLIAVLAVLVVHVPEVFGQAGSLELQGLFRIPSDERLPRLQIPSVFRQDRAPEAPLVRGQNPQTFETPAITPPPASGTMPFYGGDLRDPFLYGDPVLGGQPGAPILSGVNGPQPYRFGFTPKMDYTYLAPAGSQSPGQGRFGSNEFNFELAHTQEVGPGWILTNTPQYGIRLWDGPGTPDLPGSVQRIGWDFTLATPIVGLWSMQLDFNPSINTDFSESLGREGVNLDGNAMLFYRASPQWMFVLGVGYWDRVDKIILPYAGAVWNPNDLWELRLLFPKTRISYFLGNINNGAHWLYASGEYHVESYQISQTGISGQQVQFQDWRIALGLRSDHTTYDKFVEVGYVFGRNVDFLKTTPGFSINDTFMLRAGVKF
ncbi:MAG: DUF6268 family outer membrane beta-barrel protein [Planctomycetaceae bacterium]